MNGIGPPILKQVELIEVAGETGSTSGYLNFYTLSMQAS